jgi:3-hydroxyacyl-CoA dehydrogenase/enoyl-CoA hydratase/3-hydroxybutyryl-CoA epimerase
LHYIQTIGADTLFQRLQNLEERFGPRFTPDAGWELVSGFMPSANRHG